MRNPFKRLTPHGRLWLITTLVLTSMIFIVDGKDGNTLPILSKSPVSGTVVAHYNNDYQRYAIDELIKTDRLEQWSCLHDLWVRESNWRPMALNKQSKAMGIAQFMPVTWSLVGVKPTTDGYAQVDAGLLYIERKYGGNICKAYASNLSRGWY
jgi:hypothetical protein